MWLRTAYASTLVIFAAWVTDSAPESLTAPKVGKSRTVRSFILGVVGFFLTWTAFAILIDGLSLLRSANAQVLPFADNQPLNPPSDVSARLPRLFTDVSPRLSGSSLLSAGLSPSGQMHSVGSSADGRIVYAGALYGGVWRSEDTGVTWHQLAWPQPGDTTTGCTDSSTTPCTLPPLAVEDLAVLPSNPNVVFAVLSDDFWLNNERAGIYRSLNGGQTWELVHQAQCDHAIKSIHNIALAPDGAYSIWAATDCGIDYSEASEEHEIGATRTWGPARMLPSDLRSPPLPTAVVSIVAGPQESSSPARWVYGCNGNNILYSLDGGHTFSRDLEALTLPPDACVHGRFRLAAPPNRATLLYVLRDSGGSPYVYNWSDSGGVRRDGVQCDNCEGYSLYVKDYGASSGTEFVGPRWHQVGVPPRHWDTPHKGGEPFIRVRALPSGRHLILFSDDGEIHVSLDPPTYDSWHRLDAPDTADTSLIHVDPHTAALSNVQMDLLPSVASADRPRSGHYSDLVNCPSGGVIFIANDGGVYSSIDCGQTWRRAEGLNTLDALELAGIPHPVQDPAPPVGPALYFGGADNDTWSSFDGGAQWHGGVDNGCGDCNGFWADYYQPKVLLHRDRERTLQLFSSNYPAPPDLAVKSTFDFIDLGLPPTLYVGGSRNVSFETQLELHGNRPLVLTTRAEERGFFAEFPIVDVIQIAPAEPLRGDAMPNQVRARVWRKRVWTEGPCLARPGAALEATPPSSCRPGGWQAEGTTPESLLPAGASVVQATGGHAAPVYYVGELVDHSEQIAPFDFNGEGRYLYRSVRGTTNQLEGWDCIVPGPRDSAVHDGRCTVTQTAPNDRPSRAWYFASNPYNPNLVYVFDATGKAWLSTTGGLAAGSDNPWREIPSLSNWLTANGHIGTRCIVRCDQGESGYRIQMFRQMEFVPDEPRLRFITGAAGVFYTSDGVTTNADRTEEWHRILDPNALNCVPANSYFDKASLHRPYLYISCVGRSVIRFDALPEH